MNAAVDLDNAIWSQVNTRSLGVSAGLYLVSRTWKVEEYVTRRHTLEHDVSATIQLQPLGDIEDECV